MQWPVVWFHNAVPGVLESEAAGFHAFLLGFSILPQEFIWDEPWWPWRDSDSVEACRSTCHRFIGRCIWTLRPLWAATVPLLRLKSWVISEFTTDLGYPWVRKTSSETTLIFAHKMPQKFLNSEVSFLMSNKGRHEKKNLWGWTLQRFSKTGSAWVLHRCKKLPCHRNIRIASKLGVKFLRFCGVETARKRWQVDEVCISDPFSMILRIFRDMMVSWHRGTPSHHPFRTIGIFHDFPWNQPSIGGTPTAMESLIFSICSLNFPYFPSIYRYVKP